MTGSNQATLRLATIKDSAKLAELHVAAWKETYRGIVPDEMLASLSVERRTTAWHKILGEPAGSSSTVTHVMTVGPDFAGFASSGPQRSAEIEQIGYDGEISAVYVRRSFQKRGLGRWLMAAAAASLQDRGFEAASLWVLQDNLQARQFYEHLAGQIVGRREDVRETAVLVEVAFGWLSLSCLSASDVRIK